MNAVPFIGRQKELRNLQQLLAKKTASLVVITGRRRIGKSRLVAEFAHNKNFYSFSGLPPTPATTAQSQRDEFSRQLGEQLGLQGLKADDWGNLFTLLARQTAQGRVIILFDEISWMGSKDPLFLGKLKIIWDLQFKKNPALILILCGSVSSWIEKNIISSTGFFGRISLKLTLEELLLSECNAFLNKEGFRGSLLEKFIVLSVTGGVPWYLELINPALPASENIKKLCFEPDGMLTDEFNRIFHDLFGKKGTIYQQIVAVLAKQPAEYQEIAAALDYPSGGPLSEYLNDLVTSGFISRDYIWTLTTGKESQLSKYRLRDNYLRFYLKYMAPHIHKIKRGQFKQVAISSLPAWDSVMGLQFENLVLNNRHLIYQQLEIKPEEIIADNPFFQRKTSKQKGCQIDYLIQTKFNNFYLCEVKFSKNEINSAIIREMSQKMERFKRPKGFACLPVLIHVNGVNSEVEESGFFAKIIDFSQLLAAQHALY